MSVESFTSHRHLELVERVLHHVVGIQLIDLVHDDVHATRRRIREEEKFSPRQRLEARQTEAVGLKKFQARHWDTGVGIAISRCSGGGGAGGGGGGRSYCRGDRQLGSDRAGDGMDTVQFVNGGSG